MVEAAGVEPAANYAVDIDFLQPRPRKRDEDLASDRVAHAVQLGREGLKLPLIYLVHEAFPARTVT